MPTRPDLSNRKRSRSPSPVQSGSHKRHHEEESEEAHGDLLTDLTNVLAEIRTTPSTGEISAELLGTLRGVMLQIEHLSADETNTRAREMKDESDRCLETWFDELLARCEADGELDLNSLALALALQDEEAVCQEDEDAVSVTNSTSSHSEVQVSA
ncbi:hypothetical protein CLU79DRAFT_706374 [Phycomyces nitens]|nr:hypothetical protein CLU79DRAFT_706374 [Phycomyces nitens]